MRERKYTLPRHTNLASQGSRLGAFFVDLAIAFALTLGLLYGCFRFVFKNKTDILDEKITQQRIDSHLFFKDENDQLKYYTAESANNEFVEALRSFYIDYLPSEGNPYMTLDDGKSVKKDEYFTVEWFNLNILQVEGTGSTYFEYQKIDDQDNKNVIASIKTDANAERVNSFLQYAWLSANEDLNNVESFEKLNNEYGFYSSLEFVISAFIASTLVYIILPLILKNGVTPGKKAFGLCLCNKDGYVFKNYQLLMRYMPLLVVLFSLLLPIWKTFLMFFMVILILLLVSFTLLMASPKKCSLHDFTAGTIVVNKKTSIIFNNASEEEEYIAKEDNIEEATLERGEEPSISYEK